MSDQSNSDLKSQGDKNLYIIKPTTNLNEIPAKSGRKRKTTKPYQTGRNKKTIEYKCEYPECSFTYILKHDYRDHFRLFFNKYF